MVQIPILVVLEDNRHEVFIAYQLKPCEAESRVSHRFQAVQKRREGCVDCQDNVLIEFVVLTGYVVDDVQNQSEEGSLVEGFWIRFVVFVDRHDNSLRNVIQIDTPVVRYYLQAYNYQLGLFVHVFVV